MLRREQISRAQEKDFKQIPEVQEWLAQFDTMRPRYSFLVLNGPSMFGKTRFVSSLVKPGRLLAVDCSVCSCPDLRAWAVGKYDLVLYDELSAHTVIKYKLLFQSHINRVTLASTASNCHSYSVWLHKTPQAICSNRWEEELKEMSPSERDWLEKNSILIQVREKLWLD